MSNFVGMPPHAEEASRCRSARAEEARVLKKHLSGFCFVEKTSTIKLQVFFAGQCSIWSTGQRRGSDSSSSVLAGQNEDDYTPFENQQAGHLTNKLAIATNK